jgi:hypothetical protein
LVLYFRYRAIIQRTWNKPFFAIQASLWQLAGTVFYVVGEYFDNFKHLPANDFVWPPKFDSYFKVKYFWIIFVGLNPIWIIIPIIAMIMSYYDIEKQSNQKKKKN